MEGLPMHDLACDQNSESPTNPVPPKFVQKHSDKSPMLTFNCLVMLLSTRERERPTSVWDYCKHNHIHQMSKRQDPSKCCALLIPKLYHITHGQLLLLLPPIGVYKMYPNSKTPRAESLSLMRINVGRFELSSLPARVHVLLCSLNRTTIRSRDPLKKWTQQSAKRQDMKKLEFQPRFVKI